MGEGTRAEVRLDRLSVISLVRNPLDIVQAYHVRGEFYESRQLECHRNLIYHGSTILDIGANIGNHAMFYAAGTWAQHVYCFEPNPTARDMLLDNLRVNALGHRVDLSYVEMAVGDADGMAIIGDEPEHNLGATSLQETSAAPAHARTAVCRRLDSLTFTGDISFIKIDVEGWELKVLAGATELIRKHKPSIAVEIGWWQIREFWAWTEAHEYHVINLFQDSLHVRNYVMVPKF